MNSRYLTDVTHTQRKNMIYAKATVKKPAVGATLVAKGVGATYWATKVAPTFVSSVDKKQVFLR